MAQEIQVFYKCVQCNGTGTFDPSAGSAGSSLPCTWPECIGPPGPDGYLKGDVFFLEPGSDDLDDKHNDILDKLDDIIELLSP